MLLEPKVVAAHGNESYAFLKAQHMHHGKWDHANTGICFGDLTLKIQGGIVTNLRPESLG